jgi:hypothetical protein
MHIHICKCIPGMHARGTQQGYKLLSLQWRACGAFVPDSSEKDCFRTVAPGWTQFKGTQVLLLLLLSTFVRADLVLSQRVQLRCAMHIPGYCLEFSVIYMKFLLQNGSPVVLTSLSDSTTKHRDRPKLANGTNRTGNPHVPTCRARAVTSASSSSGKALAAVVQANGSGGPVQGSSR